ncbi:MAG: cell division FtsA domain-containing protein [bacterium]
MLDKIKNIKNKKIKKAKDDSQYVVALDIGTEFVKVLIGKVGPDQTEIIGVGRAHQSLSDMQAGAISDITSVVENCDKALAEAENQAGLSVRSAVIGIAGELVKGTTITVRVRRKSPKKPIDLEEIERIIKLVQEKAQDKARQQLSWELGGKDIEVRLVNSALVSIDIDGYPVTNPVGFQGSDVIIQLFAAFAPMIHIGALERTAQQLDLDLLAVAAEPFAVSRSVIGDDPNASMSAILMDIGGGTTDIAVINDGGVQGTKMFGIGGRAYTKSIEKELSVDFDDAEKLKLGLVNNQTPAQKIPAVEAALNKTLDVWIGGVELALSEFPKLDHLPNRILLCGGGSSLDLVMEELQNTKWYRQLPFTKQPTVQYIKPSQVVGIVDKTGQVNDHTYITAMGLLRVGLDTMQQANNTETNSIRERLDRILRT